MKKCFLCMAVVLVVTISSSVYAHYLWLNVDNYNPKVGEEIIISVGWGHKFPKDSEPSVNRLDKLFLIGPDGKTITLEINVKEERDVEPVKIRLKKAGTYLAVLTAKAGFVCKTTKGYFYKSKKQLESEGFTVLWSAWSESSAKAIINVGSPKGEAFKKEIGQRFQIVVLEDPAKLKKGKYLPVKIVFEDKPAGMHVGFVYARYVGFSEEKDTFCYTTKPDKEGIARIKILERGVWLIYVPEKIPYSNPEEAEECSFTSTLTFEVK